MALDTHEIELLLNKIREIFNVKAVKFLLLVKQPILNPGCVRSGSKQWNVKEKSAVSQELL